jgi:hypothetical protein
MTPIAYFRSLSVTERLVIVAGALTWVFAGWVLCVALLSGEGLQP